jgi:hypothetical protein
MEILNWLLFGPARLIAESPHAGFFIGAVLIGVECWLYRSRRIAFTYGFWREAPVFAGILWGIFNAYEWQMAATASANAIRLDLVVLVPILYVMTAMAMLVLRRQFSTPRN